MKHQNNYNLSNLIFENLTQYTDNDNLGPSTSYDILIVFLDRSQLVMTIVGVIANTGTAVTLIKNGQVSVALTFLVNCQVDGTLTSIKMDT